MMTELPDSTAFEDAVYVVFAVGLVLASAAGVAAMRVRAHGRRRHRFWLLSRNRSLFVACVMTASIGTCVLVLRSIHYVGAHVSAHSLVLFTPVLLISAALLVLSADGWRSRRPGTRAKGRSKIG